MIKKIIVRVVTLIVFIKKLKKKQLTIETRPKRPRIEDHNTGVTDLATESEGNRDNLGK